MIEPVTTIRTHGTALGNILGWSGSHNFRLFIRPSVCSLQNLMRENPLYDRFINLVKILDMELKSVLTFEKLLLFFLVDPTLLHKLLSYFCDEIFSDSAVWKKCGGCHLIFKGSNSEWLRIKSSTCQKFILDRTTSVYWVISDWRGFEKSIN